MKSYATTQNILGAVALLGFCAGLPARDASYSVVDTIAAPDGGYDYLSVDSDARRLYVARGYGVMAIDLASGKVTPKLLDTGGWVSAAMLLPGTGSILSTSEEDRQAIVFDRVTGAVKARIPTGEGPDAAFFEPLSKLVYVMNGDSEDVTILDPAKKAVVATVPVGGKPEAAASNGRDKVFVNIEDKSDIAVLDIATHELVGRYALPGCEEPTGLAFDGESGLLISACANGKAKLIDAASGADRGSVEIGEEADGAIFDAARRLAYVPCNDGTLTIFHLDESGKTKVVSSVKTGPGARTAALDAKTGRVYLPSVETRADSDGKEKQVPGTFRILVVAPE